MKAKFLSIVVILTSILHGGIGEKKLSVLAEGRGGLFRPTPENFTAIYGEINPMKSAILGVGYKSTYLIARYRLFEANGKSIVTGIKLEGSADWRQEFISLGIRSYAQKLFYAELAYLIGSVKESISTEEPRYTALNSTFSTHDDRGASIAVGINIPIVMGFNLSAEIEYMFFQISVAEESNSDRINIGGAAYGLGITYVF